MLPKRHDNPDFRRLFEAAPGLYLVLKPDQDYSILAASDAYLQATMTDREQIMGRGLFEVFPDNPDDPGATGVSNLRASLDRALRLRVPDAMAVQKYDVRQKSGTFEERYWSPKNSPVLGDGGEVQYIIHRVEDVTEFVRLKQKGREREQLADELLARTHQMEGEIFQRAQELQVVNRRLREANDELAHLRTQDQAEARRLLRENEERYRTLVAATSAIVWTMDAEGEFGAAQPSWQAYTGQSWEAYRNQGWLSAIRPEDRERVAEAWKDALRSRSAFECENELWNEPARSYRHTVTRAAPVLHPGGAVREWVGTVTDVEDRWRFEQQLQHTAKLESLGILAGGVAHDFNNLLTGILANASLAESRFAGAPAEDLDLLREIVLASQKAAELTRQMLAYSGKGQFLLSAVDLSALVRENATLLRTSIPKQVDLVCALGENLPPVLADAGQMQQVVMNLVINAAEAIRPEAGGWVRVTTSEDHLDSGLAQAISPGLAPGPYVSLQVRDNGPGMSEEVKARMFDPFFTTKFQGRGLGLSAVLGIVRGHRGALRVNTAPGEGTTFSLFFPASERKSAPAESHTPAAAESGEGQTILVVDDERLLRTVAERMLVDRGYRVLLAANGREALELFAADRDGIALVLLDLAMPQMGGEEALRELQRLKADVRVLLSSGYSEIEISSRFEGKGLAGFIQKPYRAVDLLRAVARAMRPSVRQ